MRAVEANDLAFGGANCSFFQGLELLARTADLVAFEPTRDEYARHLADLQ